MSFQKSRLEQAIGVCGSGTIRDIRLHGSTAVLVLTRLKEMDKSLVFGYEYVTTCETRLEKMTLNEILVSVQKLVKFHEGLGKKVLPLPLAVPHRASGKHFIHTCISNHFGWRNENDWWLLLCANYVTGMDVHRRKKV